MRDQNGTNHTQPAGAIMAMNAVETASCLVRRFEQEDTFRLGSHRRARKALADKFCVPPGTLKNAREGRLKRICVEFFARLKAEEMHRLNQAIAGAEHDLHVARAIGLDPRSDAFLALEAAVFAARDIKKAAP